MSTHNIHRFRTLAGFILSLLAIGAISYFLAADWCMIAVAQPPNNFAKIAADLEMDRRDAAKRELDELQQKRRNMEDRVNFANAVVRASFHVEQGHIAPPAKTVKVFERWKQVRETTIQGLVGQPERFAGDIQSGKALNFFLQECGPTAFASTTLKQQGVPQPGRPDDHINDLKLPFNVTRHIQYRQGLTGPMLTGRLNQDPLDTRWVSAIRGLPTYTKKIERFRDQALAELKQKQPVSPKTADGLLDAINDLRAEVQAQKRQAISRVGGGNPRPHQEYFRFLEAEKQVQKLSTGALKVIEAHELEDVTFDEIKNLQNGITIEELLSYMHRNNLTFAAADANGQAGYNHIFQLMLRYYVYMSGLEHALKVDDALGLREIELNRIQLGDSLSTYGLSASLSEGLRSIFGK